MTVLIALLAGCTTTISGAGRLYQPPALPAQSIPGGGPHRVPQQGPLGDLVTADLCGGISMRAFDRFGYARVHGWQTADTCYIDLLLRGGNYFQLNTWGEQSSDFDNTDGSPRTAAHGTVVFSFHLRGTDCERALEFRSVVLETHTYNIRGAVPRRLLCAAAATLVRQEIAAFSPGPVPSRSLARPSLTRFDMCSLAVRGQYRKISALEDGLTFTILQGAGCNISAPATFVSIRVAFISLDFALFGRNVSVHGHRLQVARFGRSCEVISLRGVTSDGRAREILDVAASPHGARTRSQCRIAVPLTAALLSAAHLH